MFYQIALVLCCIQFREVFSRREPYKARACLGGLGCVTGTVLPGFSGPPYEAFLEIPYAYPPIGKRRFKNPELWADPWRTDIPFVVDKEDCAQKNYLFPTYPISGKEDCLYLNIYRPANMTEILPVMVYIHGGGFFFGTASRYVHGPEFFMDTREVILVTFTYRLGPFGFLSTCDDNMPGNFGLKDQNMALQFVHKHISAFGGDPQQVTIFGQSAGGVSVHLHMLSPLSRGLFQRAISMSGNAAAPFADVTRDPLEQLRLICEKLGMTRKDGFSEKNMTAFIMKQNTNDILNAGDVFKVWDVDPLTNYRPVIEFPNEGAFLTADPKYLIASGQFHKVPWMTGIVPNEGSIRALGIIHNPLLRADFNKDFKKHFLDLMELPELSQSYTNQEAILRFYFNNTRELNDHTAQGLTDSITHRGFYHPFFESIRNHVRLSDPDRAPVYLYRFAFRGYVSYSYFATFSERDYGVSHCDDLIYLFRSPVLFDKPHQKQIEFDSAHYRLMMHMIDNYVHFAKTGKPLSSLYQKPCDKRIFDTDNEICDYWEIINQGTTFESHVRSDFDMRPVKFWEQIIELFDWCYY